MKGKGVTDEGGDRDGGTDNGGGGVGSGGGCSTGGTAEESEGRGGTMSTEEVGGEGEIGGRKRKERCSTDFDDVGVEE